MATDTIVAREATSAGCVLREDPWEIYRALRSMPGSDEVRMTYLDGTLYLMSPEYIRERAVSDLAQLVLEVATAHAIDVEPTGTTTLRRQGRVDQQGAAKEPDNGFYIGENAERMRQKGSIDLAIDPPPDLAIEVDRKADSSASLSTYARIGVPEPWRYRPGDRTLWFGRLRGTGYETIDRSIALPMLSPELVLSAVEARAAGNLSLIAWRVWLAEWAPGLVVGRLEDQVE